MNKEDLAKYLAIVRKISPRLADAFDVLDANKTEMEQVNTYGADNYYHRKAMCEHAQKGYTHAMYSLGLVVLN